MLNAALKEVFMSKEYEARKIKQVKLARNHDVCNTTSCNTERNPHGLR